MRVTEKELDALVLAEVRQPVPGEHALDADNQVVAKAFDGLQEFVRLGSHIAMQSLVSVTIENAQIHPLGVQVHATIKLILPVVESHHGTP